MRELFLQAFTVIFARGFIRLAQLIVFLLLARFLTPAEFGVFGVISTSIPLAAILGSLGLRQSLAYFIGRKELTVGEAIATMLAVWPPLAATSGAVVWFFYGRSLQGFSESSAAVMICLGVAGSMFIMLAQGMFLGRGEVRLFSLTETMPRVLLAVFSVALVLAGLVTLVNSLWIFVASFLIAVPVALYFSARNVGGFTPKFEKLPRMFAYGLAFAINLFMVTLNFRMGMFILEHVAGPAAAGQYYAAARINEIFLEAATAFGLVLFSRSVRSESHEELLTQNARIACWMFWTFMLGGFAVIALAPLFLHVLAGQQYADAAGVLQIMALGLGPAAAAKIIYSTIAGKGQPLFGSAAIGAGLAVNGGLGWLLIGHIGPLGGAISLVAAQYTVFIMYIIVCRARFDVPIGAFLIPARSDIRSVRSAVNHVLPSFRK
ncbi:MAG: oligosaccharide flippase family protein [Parvibaculum sp.]|uniref:oligosaccharide flippase family protein n=1 Tax=Parvibaculum sp. TaxID=2024848 RepID=UPI0025E929C4|nr:oligosaccharide flippase family protein [Parvibaculum sp.]MCE9649113.1 oligosaccharide flippase family protein [Parvibaculum sp.]